MSLYTAKKAILSPRTALRRRRAGLEGPARMMFELHYYRRPMANFVVATKENPEILTDAELDECSIVLDVGAHLGEWTRQISDRYGSTVVAFEPDPAGYRQLQATFADEPDITVFDYGLGARDERARLSLAGPGSSFYGDEAPWGYAEAQLRDVVAVLDELGHHEIDLLKLNIEGGEYDVLDRLIESGWITRVRQLSVQFHEWHPNAYVRRWSIRRALRRSHEEMWDYPWIWEFWSRRPER